MANGNAILWDFCSTIDLISENVAVKEDILSDIQQLKNITLRTKLLKVLSTDCICKSDYRYL